MSLWLSELILAVYNWPITARPDNQPEQVHLDKTHFFLLRLSKSLH
jgi:hypothetical protein